MKRYEFQGPGDVGEEGMYESPDGEYVLYNDAQAEIERLRETLTYPQITKDASPETFKAVLRASDKGDPVNGQDLINALMWRVRNQTREITRLNDRLQAVSPTSKQT